MPQILQSFPVDLRKEKNNRDISRGTGGGIYLLKASSVLIKNSHALKQRKRV